MRGTVEPKRDYHHGDLRRALVAAAVRHVAEAGVETLTLRDLARQVGVSHGAPYRHFADKRALLREVAEEGFARLRHAMSEATASLSDPEAKLEAVGRVYVDFALGYPAHLGLMFGPERADECAAGEGPGQATLDFVLEIIRDGQASGRFREGDAELLATSAWAFVHGLSTLLGNGRLMPQPAVPRAEGFEFECRARDELVRSAMGVFLQGLRNPASRS